MTRLRFLDEDGKSYPQWENVELKDISQVVMGQSPKGSSYTKTPSKNALPLIQGNADLSNLKSLKTFSETGSKKSQPGDILLSVRAPVGPTRICQNEAWIGRGVASIKSNPYVYHYLNHLYSSNYWENIEQGSTFKAINRLDIEKLPVPLPSLPEQEKIAEFLGLLDERIEAQRERVSLLEQQKKAWQKRIFARKYRFTDENGEFYPEWVEEKLVAVAELKNGNSISSNLMVDSGPIRVITIKNVQDGEKVKKTHGDKFLLNKPKTASPHQTLKVGDILLSMTGNVGRIAVVEEEGFFLNQRVGLIVPNKSEIIPGFLSQSLRQDSFKLAMNKVSQGGAQKNISKKDVDSHIINIPSLPEQEKIAGFLGLLDEQLEAERVRLSLLVDEKKAYSDRIFS